MDDVTKTYSDLMVDNNNVSESPKVLRELVGLAGVRFNGDNPWDIQINDDEELQDLWENLIYNLKEIVGG